MKKLKNKFNVIWFNFNAQKFEPYDIIPFFVDVCRYENFKTFEEYKDRITSEAHYYFWARCEYEIILQGWPCTNITEKWDVYRQIMMNIDIITNLVMDECNEYRKYKTFKTGFL